MNTTEPATMTHEQIMAGYDDLAEKKAWIDTSARCATLALLRGDIDEAKRHANVYAKRTQRAQALRERLQAAVEANHITANMP